MIEELLARYWGYVQIRGEDDCWNWCGSVDQGGYGKFRNGNRRYDKGPVQSPATHVALAIAGRPRPAEDQFAMHICDRPWCVNPRHLRWGTKRENHADMRRKGRSWGGARVQDALDPIAVAAEMDAAAANLGGANRWIPYLVIRRIRASDKTALALAEELGLTENLIERVRQSRRWRFEVP